MSPLYRVQRHSSEKLHDVSLNFILENKNTEDLEIKKTTAGLRNPKTITNCLIVGSHEGISSLEAPSSQMTLA